QRRRLRGQRHGPPPAGGRTRVLRVGREPVYRNEISLGLRKNENPFRFEMARCGEGSRVAEENHPAYPRERFRLRSWSLAAQKISAVGKIEAHRMLCESRRRGRSRTWRLRGEYLLENAKARACLAPLGLALYAL